MMATEWKRVRRRIGWAALFFVLIAAIGLLALVLSQPSGPYSREEIRRLTALLNESAAVATPHHRLMSSETREANLALLQKVEAGRELSTRESRAYRILYQNTLRENRWKLKPFDRELTVRTDLGRHRRNNIGGRGIAGDHDHHDDSARANFAALHDSLTRIESAGGLFGSLVRIRHANRAYKELADIVLHLGTAPHTVSIDYMPAGSRPSGTLAASFEEVLRAYKAAQFERVNSPAYVAHVRRAMAAYDEMVLEMQSLTRSELSPMEERLAGRWLAPHTLAPAPDPNLSLRFER